MQILEKVLDYFLQRFSFYSKEELLPPAAIRALKQRGARQPPSQERPKIGVNLSYAPPPPKKMIATFSPAGASRMMNTLSRQTGCAPLAAARGTQYHVPKARWLSKQAKVRARNDRA